MFVLFCSILLSFFINNFPLDYNPDHVRAEKIIKSSHIIIDREVFFPSEDIQINIKLDDGATGKVIVNINERLGIRFKGIIDKVLYEEFDGETIVCIMATNGKAQS